MADSNPDVRWMTYAEAAAALRVNPESVARQMRRHGWDRRKGNDKKPRVAVPVSLLPVPDAVPVNVPDNSAESTPSVPDIKPPPSPDPDTAALMMALAVHAHAATERAGRMEAQLLAATERAAAAEAALAEVRDALVEARRPLWHRWFWK